jgi:hypothetical protein
MSLLTKVLNSVSKHSPVIFMVTAIGGVIGTAFEAISATPKVIDLLKEVEQEKGEELTTKEIISISWKEYIPTMVYASLTISSIVAGTSIALRRNAALISLVALTEKGIKQYKESVEKHLDRPTFVKLKEDMKEDILRNTDEEMVIYTGKGNTLCYDSLSGRYFRSDRQSIVTAVNKISRDMLSEHFVTLNSLYDELGLSHTKLGDITGWHIDDGILEESFSSLLTEKGTPCLVMDFVLEPRYDYNRW